MNVSTDELQNIVGSLWHADKNPFVRENRREPRVQLRTPLQIIIRAGQPVGTDVQAVNVQVRDISNGGIGLLRSRRMNLDEPFIASLPRAGQDPVAMLCGVMYWEPLAESLHSVGARFLRTVSAAEMQHPAMVLNRAAAEASTFDLSIGQPIRRAS